MLKPYAGFNHAVVTSRTDWTDNVFSLRVSVAKTPYVAGQFVKLALYNEQGELIRRAYSIVNHPQDHKQSGALEFLLITAEDGQLSPKLHQLQVGDELLVGCEASGFMTLDEVPHHAKQLWLLSTGTAIGPYLAMLEDKGVSERFERIILVNATRYQTEQTYQEDIAQLAQRFQEKFTYVPVISRESVSGALSGRIPMLLDTNVLQDHVGTEFSEQTSFVYLCGNPAMVKETSESLKSLGLNKHLRRQAGQFSSENYW